MNNREGTRATEKQPQPKDNALNSRHKGFQPGGDARIQGDRQTGGEGSEKALESQKSGDRHRGFKPGEASQEKGDSSEVLIAKAGSDQTKEYRQIEIVDQKGKSLGEFDRIQNNVIVEEKSAEGLETKDPRTGKSFQTADQWAEKHIYEKTDTRIKNIDQAAATRPTKDGSHDAPTLDEIKQMREIQFRIKSNMPEVERATNKQLERLRSKYPDWKFSATYGS